MSHEGRQLGEFEILEKLGQGGMGAVYKARQTSLNRIVALKLLPAHYAADADFLARFKNESAAAASLNHPNIVQVYSAGVDGGVHFFAMEYVEGESLGARLQRKGRIDPREMIAIACYLAQALDHAWRKARVIHRDIKPDNIFLSREGTVKLGDLGLAKALGNQGSITQTGTVMGTPYYVSPEQAIGAREIDFRADIYSLGCTIYHAVTGLPPYQGENAMSVMLQHVSQPAPKVQAVWRECPPPLADLLTWTLEKRAEERPQSYEALLQKLYLVVEGLDRPEPAAAAAASLNISVPAAPSASAPAARPASEPDATPPERPPARRAGPRVRGGAKMLAIAGGVAVAAVALLPWGPWNKRMRPAAKAAGAITTATQEVTVFTATKDTPRVNSLGMKFVPVPIIGGPTAGQRVLFSVWDTRVQDYDGFAKETGRFWPKPDFEQGPLHPAVMVSWEDTGAFCRWLTDREHAAGTLPKQWRYRIPSDHEWSCAAEIGEMEDSTRLPDERSGRLPAVFPWGTQWPPPKGAGNFAGDELRAAQAGGRFTDLTLIAGYDDGFVNTSPVGSFAANRFGLYDMRGNVWQWCEDWSNSVQKQRVLRGASWDNAERNYLMLPGRSRYYPLPHNHDNGFRCVLAPKVSDAEE